MAADNRRLKTDVLTEYEKLLKTIFSKPYQEWQKDPASLAQSKLASPYFLSHFLPNDGVTNSDVLLGQALLNAICQAVNSLWQEGPPQDYDAMKAVLEDVRDDKRQDHYHAVHLELRFFKKFLRPTKVAAIYDDYLFISPVEEFSLFNGTVRRVGRELLSLLGQSPKSLPNRPDTIVGVGGNLAQLKTWLHSGQSVNLSGQGGIGKSTLATFVAHAWPHASFWYTIRPHLNDRLSTFLFELGQFLRQQGHSALWKYVLSEGGSVQNSHIALDVLADDLLACQAQPPLLIVDELDRLYSQDFDLAKAQHIEFLGFLEAMRGQVPTLFVGQQAILESDNYLELTGLAPVQIVELLQQRSISPQPPRPDIERLHQATQGNPRLLLLCIALYESERVHDKTATFTHIVTIVSQTPGFGPILKRLWDRLDIHQRELLQRLSVYPESAPSQYWPTEKGEVFKEAAKRLLELRLVEQHTTGSVGLLPALQERIYNEQLTPDWREVYHLDAATILTPLAEYTDATYHLAKGGEPGQAIQLWFPMMADEIQRGNAGIAYTIFMNMTQRNLPLAEQRTLGEIQAHLHELYGEIQAGLDSVRQIDLGEASEQRARLFALRGRFEDALGYPYSAQESYQLSIDTTARLMGKTANAYYGYSMVHVHQRELQAVEKIALQMELELLIIRGILAQEAGEFSQAYARYNEALAIGQKLDDQRKVALSYQRLSGIQLCREQFDDAIWYAEQAKQYYDRIGDRLAAARVDNLLCGIHLETKNYAEAIRVGERAIRFFKASKYSYFATTTMANVAEAYFYQGDHEQAAKVANQVLDNEEPHVEPYAYYTLGLIREANGKFHDAVLYFERSLNVAESTGDSFMQAFARRAYGKMICLCDDAVKGREELNHALSQFEKMEKTREVEETEKLLAEYGSF